MPVVKHAPREYVRVGQQKFWFLPTVKVTEATAPLRDYARQVGNTPLVVTSRGKPVAALIPIDGLDLDTFRLATNDDFINLIEQSRRKFDI